MSQYTRLINRSHPLSPDYRPVSLIDAGIPFDAPLQSVFWSHRLPMRHESYSHWPPPVISNFMVSPVTVPTVVNHNYTMVLLKLHRLAQANIKVVLPWMCPVSALALICQKNLQTPLRENGSMPMLHSMALFCAILRINSILPDTPGNPGISGMSLNLCLST